MLERREVLVIAGSGLLIHRVVSFQTYTQTKRATLGNAPPRVELFMELKLQRIRGERIWAEIAPIGKSARGIPVIPRALLKNRSREEGRYTKTGTELDGSGFISIGSTLCLV